MLSLFVSCFPPTPLQNLKEVREKQSKQPYIKTAPRSLSEVLFSVVPLQPLGRFHDASGLGPDLRVKVPVRSRLTRSATLARR